MRGSRVAITPDIIEKLSHAILVGSPYELAAKYAGLSKDTFDRWRKAMPTAKPGTPLAELRDRLHWAEGRAALGGLALINKAAQVDWRAAGWLLSHRYPEQYGASLQKVAMTDPSGERAAYPELTVILALPDKAPTPEEWAENVKQLAAPSAQNGSTRGGKSVKKRSTVT